MNVLNITPDKRPFFVDQIQCLEEREINQNSMVVPGRHSLSDSRTYRDYLRFFPSVIKESVNDYDIVHSHFGLTAPFAIAQPNRPIVITLWGSDTMGGNKFSKVNNVLAKQFDAVVLPSKTMADSIDCNYYHIPFGVDTDIFRPIDQNLAREKLGWNKSDDIVLFPARKGNDVKNYSLARDLTNSLDTETKIKSISSVPHDQVPLYMNAANAVLITSHRESGPMVLKEAALCNVPIVSTDVGFASDILPNVRNSYVSDSKEELRHHLEKLTSSNYRSDGRKYADDWSLSRMGEDLEKLYDGLMT
jgi:glycosyltransferase involved in cell wall biosynthesis